MEIGFMQGRLVNPEKRNTIQFFPQKNWKKEILIAKKLKLNLMEWTINYENLKKNPIYSSNGSKKIRTFIKKNKFKVQSATFDFFMQKPFFKEKKNFFYLKLLKKIIRNVQILGVKYIVIPLVDNSSIKNINQEIEIVKEMNKLSGLLCKNNKILFEIDYKPEKVLNFINKFNYKFGINYDTGNSASLNYDFEKEKKYFGHVYNIHIKDRVKFGKTVRLGKGNWKSKKFFSYLKKIKYKKNLILQTARSANNNHENEILTNIKFIKQYI